MIDHSDDRFLMMTRCPPLVGGSSYKYPARQSHVLRGNYPALRREKLFALALNFISVTQIISRFGSESSASTYPPESGQSRCLSLSPLVVIG